MARITDIEDFDVDTLSPEDIDYDRVRSALSDEDNLTRDRAAAVCLAVAEDDVEAVLPLLPALTDRLEDDNVNVLLKTLAALNVVAEAHPDSVADGVGGVCALLNHDLPRIQLSAGRLAQLVGVEHPEWFAPHAETLLAMLSAAVVDPTSGAERMGGFVGNWELREQLADIRRGEELQQYSVRAIAGNLLVEVAARDPDALVPFVPTITDLLDAADPNVVACAAELLANVATDDPDAIADAVPELIECLDSQSTAVQARTIRALGFAEATEAIDPLRSLAADESADENVRDIASGTVEWISRDAASIK